MRKANEESSIVDEGASPSSSVSRRRVLRGALGVAAVTVPGLQQANAQDAATPGATASTSLYVYPMPGTVAASPGTQISFRGELPDELGPIHVSASESGEHSGTIVAHSDGNGASWFPDFPFRGGEEVRVRTRLDIAGSDDGDFSFTCAVLRDGRARPDQDEEGEESDYLRFRTRPGLVPPRLETELYEGETAPGYLFMAAKEGGARNGALIVDNQGDPVWFLPADIHTQQIYDLKVVDFRGEPALIWWQGISVSGQGSGHWVLCNNAYEELATIRIGNGFDGGDMHDVALTPQNTAIIGAYSTIRWDLTAVDGEAEGWVIDSVLQEIDIETGAVMFEWHSIDHVDIEESQREIEPDERESPYDYLHYNSVAVDEDGNLIISGRNTWATYKIDRVTGEVIWRLGGKTSDFEMGEGAETAWQHDSRPMPNGEISIFDNGAQPKVHDESRGLVLALDMEEMTATTVREYLHPDKISAGSQGNMQLLPNGNVLLGWGSEPLASEFAADGTLLFDVRMPGEKHSYRTYRFEWIGRPTDAPHVLAEPGSDGETTIFVSWNGATEVAAWRVLGGDAEDALEPLAEPAPRTGFETEIPVPATARFWAVEALDNDGGSMATSRTIDMTA